MFTSLHPKHNAHLSLCNEIVADFLITGDRKPLAIESLRLKGTGIVTSIITPRAFVEEV
jgi:predicted nucleic acid-binding protein